MNYLKEEDSKLRFVGNGFLSVLTGQSTHEDLVKKSGLRRILFDRSCLRRNLFHKKSGLPRILFTKNPLLNHFISSFLFCLPIHW